MTTLREIFETV